ncbi:hypothetical protein BGW42_000121 [Actinomortierella wolfii]|nr:hypothetical protein BGW42_000121 [Actinomortierella wolfii]
MNSTKPQQSIQRRLHTNARLCHLAQTLFGSQGIQDLAIVGVLFGNNIHQIGRFQIQCNGTMSQGMFSIHELVNSRVLAVSGRSKKGRKAGRRRRQLKKQQLSSSRTDHEAPLTPPSELSKNHHHQQHQQRPILTPTLIAELFPLVVFRTIRKHTRRDRARLGGHSFFSPLPPPITTGRSSSSSRPPSFTPGTSSPSAQTAVASTSSSNSCPSQEPWSFGSLTPSDRLLGDNYDLRGGEASFSYDLSPPNDDELVVSSPDVLRRLFQRCLFHVPDLPLPDELCFLAAASFPLPQSLRALHVAWTMEFLKRRVRTERRSRQQERRMAKTPSSHGSPNNHHRHSSTSLFQRSPDMITVMEEECDEEEEKEKETLTVKDGIKQDYDVPASPTASAAVAVAAAPQHTSSQSQSTAKSACLGGLEFRPEVYAYKMRLARAARARSSKQSASAASSRSNSTTTNDNSSATQPSQTCQSAAVDDAASAAETNSSSSQPSTPVVDTHNIMTNDPPSTQDSPSTFPTIEILKLQQDKERPDKRLMQQLLSLENKVPRIVRKWAHHARHFFAEELMREDSLAQKWVDEQRIEVVLGTGCHGHLSTFVSSSAHHLQLQQPRLSSSATTAFAMHTASHTPPSPPSLPLPAQDNQQQQQQQQQHQCQSHVPPAAHMQQQVQEAMTNTSNMHTANMMTTTTIATTATTTTMTDTTTTSNNTSTHSPRLITGCSTPVAASTPKITSFAEGIRLSHQNDSMVDFGMSSATAPSSSGITAGHHRSSLRNSFQNLGAAATSTMTSSSAGSVSSGVPQFYPYHHRVSTSQQMLSLHLWLSCLVSPISPDQLVHEGYFEPLDPQVYP